MENTNQDRTIVVGVDGSDHSIQALRWAVAEAERRSASVTAVTAWMPDAVPSSVVPLPVLEPVDHGLAQQPYQHRLAEAVRRATRDHPDVPVRQVVRSGTASVVLTTESKGADLLVLGSHGHGRMLTALVGSVSAACIRTAYCPVVVIPNALAERSADSAGSTP